MNDGSESSMTHGRASGETMEITGALDAHVINVWSPLANLLSVVDRGRDQEGWWEDLPEYMPPYAETVKAGGGYTPEDERRILTMSPSENVAQYDDLVRQYNSDRDRIARERDVERVRYLYGRAREIVYRKQ